MQCWQIKVLNFLGSLDFSISISHGSCSLLVATCSSLEHLVLLDIWTTWLCHLHILPSQSHSLMSRVIVYVTVCLGCVFTPTSPISLSRHH